MIITNKMDLPVALVNAISRDQHNEANHYSATTLLKGTKEIILTSRHWDDLIQDAADSIWAIFGTATHSIFEKHQDDTFKEEKFSMAVSNSILTGKLDSYDMANATIIDWKTASVWKVQFKDFDDWKKQGLIYAWLLTQEGLDVQKCKFIALLKDHSKSKARKDSSYPQSPVFVYEFKVTTNGLSEIHNFITTKIQDIEKSTLLDDDTIAPCTESERWADSAKFAVMKEGRKSAVRVFENKADAEKMATDLGKGHTVQERPSESRKCADYCLCKDFCNFYKDNIKAVEND